MGLDSVELVLAYEDAFGVDIPNEIAAELETPRSVVNYMLNRLRTADRAPCLHQQAFHLVRRSLRELLDLPRDQAVLESPLDRLIPRERRAVLWTELGSSLGVRPISSQSGGPWPQLARPVWLRWLLFAFFLAVWAVAATFLRIEGMRSPSAFWLGILVAIVALYAGNFVTRPWKREFPQHLRTLRHLVEHLAALAPHAAKGAQGWTREQVEWVVRRVTIEELRISSFSLDDHFVRDLRVD